MSRKRGLGRGDVWGEVSERGVGGKDGRRARERSAVRVGTLLVRARARASALAGLRDFSWHKDFARTSTLELATTTSSPPNCTPIPPSPRPPTATHGHHVCAQLCRRRRQAPLVEEDVQSFGEVVCQCRWLQAARLEVRTLFPAHQFFLGVSENTPVVINWVRDVGLTQLPPQSR